jgi:hypothetical protein
MQRLLSGINNIEDSKNQQIQARVLLYSGSQSKFITEYLANILKSTQNPIDIPVKTVN